MKSPLEIGKPLRLTVCRYDKVPEPPQEEFYYHAEVVGWHETQVVVRVPGYAVLKFWKRNGVEVGNKDYERRGFRLDLDELNDSKAAGVQVDLGE